MPGLTATRATSPIDELTWVQKQVDEENAVVAIRCLAGQGMRRTPVAYDFNFAQIVLKEFTLPKNIVSVFR